jgi:hypothetical protein
MSHRLASFILVFCFSLNAVALAQEAAAVHPVNVCIILQDLDSYTGKVVAVVGRFSFRREGRFLSEENCGSAAAILPVAFDRKLAPKTPEHLEIEAGAVNKLLKTIQQTTALTKFRFGTPDYDRWAVVYGRVEPDKQLRTVVLNTSAHGNPVDAGPAQLVCAGDSVVMFIVDRY